MPSPDARKARDDGMLRAVVHADEVVPNWSERAYLALVDYAATHAEFTIEQVRASVDLPIPPSTRAWGPVIRRALRAGVVIAAGWTAAEDPKVHCNMVMQWRSLTFPRPEATRYRTPVAEKARTMLLDQEFTIGIAHNIDTGQLVAVPADEAGHVVRLTLRDLLNFDKGTDHG